MKQIKHTSLFYTIVAVAIIIFYLLDSTEILTLKIGTAHPILLIPLLISVSMAAREWVGLVFGGLIGILLDITAADTYCFNLVAFALIGCVCGLLCSYFVNDNIYSALVLSVCSSLAYFTVKWLVFFVFDGNADALQFFVNHSLLSAIYTSLFIVPFYYAIHFISKKTNYIS